jgi:signal transduction histidine kinase
VRQTIQIIRLIWMVFAILAIGCAIPGIPHYLSLAQSPCGGANCFDFQLTPEAAEALVPLGVKLADNAAALLVFLLFVATLLVVTAAWLVWRKPDNRASVTAAFVGVAAATSTLIRVQASVDARFLFPAHLVLFVQMAGLFSLFCLFPDGRFKPGWLRWVALVYVVANGVYLFPNYASRLAPGTLGGSAWTVFQALSALTVIAVLYYRHRRSADAAQQEQMLWLLASISLALLYILSGKLLRSLSLTLDPLAVFNVGPATEFISMFLAVGSFTCLLVALMNYEPLDMEILVNRTLVYLALTAFIIATYGLIVGYLSTAFHADNSFFALLATGLIAIVFQPLRDRLQRTANRLIYGERHEPYQVLARLGRRLESAIDPASALELTVETVAQALKLPYAAIAYTRAGESVLAAAYGVPLTALTCFPLTYAGETIGEFLAGQRTESEAFSRADLRLLGDLARQVSVTTHSALLAVELQAARLRIVEAREETRRRLGNDLHDGVGHQLAGLARKTEQAADQVAEDPQAAIRTLDEINRQINATSAQVRALAHQLHPPELEVLGLVGALRERTQAFPGLAIRFDAPGSLPALPAAVETAAYYIALAALTNIEKHAAACTCLIRLSGSGPAALHLPTLTMEITDDGKGLASQTPEGLGLLSMQGRAVEVGGTCQVIPNPSGGTTVRVCLPFQSVPGGNRPWN